VGFASVEYFVSAPRRDTRGDCDLLAVVYIAKFVRGSRRPHAWLVGLPDKCRPLARNGLRGDRSFALLTPGLFSVDVLEADFGKPASEYALDVTSG
jgi:hypothetical protein